MTTVLIVIYFSINTYIASEEWCDTKAEFLMYWLIGLPLIILQVLWLILKEYWWKFSNKTGASFYWGFYISGRYKNLSKSKLETIKDQADNNPNPRVRKWAKKVHDTYGGGCKK